MSSLEFMNVLARDLRREMYTDELVWLSKELVRIVELMDTDKLTENELEELCHELTHVVCKLSSTFSNE